MLRYDSTIQNGQIVETGSFHQLMKNNGPFSRLLSEFGGAKEEGKEQSDALEEAAVEESAVTSPIEKVITKKDIVRLTKKHMGKAAGTGKLEVRYEAR